VADEDHHATLRDVALALAVHLGDERTGCVEDAQAALPRVILDDPRNAVGAEDRDRAGGNFGEVLDETRPLGAQALDDVPVVDDLMPDVDGCAKPDERLFDDVDGADDARAKAARLRKHYTHARHHAGRKDRTMEYIRFSVAMIRYCTSRDKAIGDRVPRGGFA
jgi:hypothetical protein